MSILYSQAQNLLNAPRMMTKPRSFYIV